ncbi:MAG: EAL domain-containing protein [Lautropia sp.]|nr:EAL domain-containing protein [Lautropia sp.]
MLEIFSIRDLLEGNTVRLFGLTLKPVAQWPYHSQLGLWTFCLMAVLLLALRVGMYGEQVDQGTMPAAILFVQALSLLPIIGLLHCLFRNRPPQTLPSARSRWTWLTITPIVAVSLSCALPFLNPQQGRLLASGIDAMLSVIVVIQLIDTLRRQPSLEGRLAALATMISSGMLNLTLLESQWSLSFISPVWLQLGIIVGPMGWVAAFLAQSAGREKKLQTSQSQFEHAALALHRIYNTSPVALLSLDGEARIQRWNQRAADAFGADLMQHQTPHIFALLGEAVGQQLLADLKKNGEHHSELTLSRNGIEKVWVLEARIRDGGSELGMHEVTAHARRAATFQEIAEHDALTGTPNLIGLRRLLTKQLTQMRSSTPLSCLYIDIQNFSQINQLFGRQAGDAVLRTVAQQLQKHLPAPAISGRVRDDHFLVIMPGSELTLTRTRANTLLSILARTAIEHQGLSIHIDVALGAVESVAGMNADRLIEAARLACTLSRQEGAPRPYAVMADSPALSEPDATQAFGGNLRQHLPENMIRLYGQAITSLQQDVPNQSLTVLPRLLGANGQLQLPNRLQHAASRQGASAMLDRFLLTQILQTMATRRVALPTTGMVIFRLSPLSLAEPGFTGNLIRLLGADGTAANRLCLELPSQVLAYDPEGARAFLKDLRLLSVHSGIDLLDSNDTHLPVHQLAQLPIRHIRLDGRLFSDLENNPYACKEVTAIKAMCEVLGIECLVDQVNNPLDLRPLRELGIDLVQGSAVAAVRPLEDALSGREEEPLLPMGTLIPV